MEFLKTINVWSLGVVVVSVFVVSFVFRSEPIADPQASDQVEQADSTPTETTNPSTKQIEFVQEAKTEEIDDNESAVTQETIVETTGNCEDTTATSQDDSGATTETTVECESDDGDGVRVESRTSQTAESSDGSSANNSSTTEIDINIE